MIAIRVDGVEVWYEFTEEELERLPACIGRINPRDEFCLECEFYFDCMTIATIVDIEKEKRKERDGP